MRKFSLLAILAATLALSACGTVADLDKGGRQDPTTPSQFLTLVTRDKYEGDSSRTWGWTNEKPLTEVKVGDKLAFVFGYLRGTYRVELNEWNWNEDGDKVSVPDLPLVWNHDEGNVQTVRTFNWTPSRDGEYHFNLWLSNQAGKSLEGTPIELVVKVSGSTTDPEPGGDLLSWVNATINGRVIASGENINLSPGDGISFNWGARSSSTNVIATVVNDSRELYRSTEYKGSKWLSENEGLRDGTTVFRVEASGDGKSEVRTVSFHISRNDTEPAPPPLSDQINWFDATLNGSQIRAGQEVSIRLGDGISFNWGVNSSVDRVTITVRSDGKEIFSSSSRENSEWISYSRLYDGEVVFQIRLEDSGRSYTRTLRFWATKSGTPSSSRARVTFDLRTPSGYSDRDVRLRILDNDGYTIDIVRNGDTLTLSSGTYEGALIEDNTFAVSSASFACTRDNSREVSLRVSRGDDVTCRVNFSERSSSPEPTGAPASVWYNGKEYTGVVVIPLYGNNFEIRWDAKWSYDSVYVQLYKVGQKDFFQSSERTGSRSFDPSSLGVGDYILRLNQYVDGRNDLVTVSIKIQ